MHTIRWGSSMNAQVSGSSVSSFSILQDARPFLEEESVGALWREEYH